MTNQEIEKLKPHIDSIEYVIVFETEDENYVVTATDEKWTTQIKSWIPDQL